MLFLLRVDIGLFSISSCGGGIRFWVSSMCWCLLLERVFMC